jgi:DNA-binding MarR family transcriptional regulator
MKRTATATKWLNTTEMRAWRGYVETIEEINIRLEAALADHQLTLGDYQVLVFLSEQDDRRMRMCDLATMLHLSPSGLTRRLDGLVKSGFVSREPNPRDRREMLAVLTTTGYRKLELAAPDHVDSVRTYVLDHLSARQIEQLGDIFAALKEGLGLPATTNEKSG